MCLNGPKQVYLQVNHSFAHVGVLGKANCEGASLDVLESTISTYDESRELLEVQQVVNNTTQLSQSIKVISGLG